MTFHSPASHSRPAAAWRGLGGTQRLALLALGLALPFLLAWQLKPLYADNQNTKFLQALAEAGVGLLREDWLAQTKDGLPLFTALLRLIYATVGEAGFYLFALASFALFLFCALVIYERVAGREGVPREGLLPFLAALFAIAAVTDVHEIVLGGFAEQYILGGYFQTADFGVLLICAVLLFDAARVPAAVACVIGAAAMHPGYAAPGAVLIAIFMGHEAMRSGPGGGGRSWPGLAAGVLGLAALAAISLALKLHFAPTSPELHREAHRILTAIRIPRHADPWHWVNLNVAVQLGLCIAAGLLLPPGRLRLVIRAGTAAMTLFTAIAFLPGTETYRLIAPWRVSVVIVPLASIALVALAVVRLHRRGGFGPGRARRMLVGSVGVIAAATAVGGAFTAAKFMAPEPAYLAYVRANLTPGQLYLTPPSEMAFRLATGAPHYVTFKSHPYQDVEVLEWNRRVERARDLYAAPAMGCGRLRQIAAEDRITHVVTTRGRASLDCAFAAAVFQAEGATVYRLDLAATRPPR